MFANTNQLYSISLLKVIGIKNFINFASFVDKSDKTISRSMLSADVIFPTLISIGKKIFPKKGKVKFNMNYRDKKSFEYSLGII